MSEYLSACLASSGSSSPMRMPGDVGLDGLVQRAAVVVAGLRLGIERVEVRRAAPQPDLDDRLGLGLRPAGGPRPARRPGCRPGRRRPAASPAQRSRREQIRARRALPQSASWPDVQCTVPRLMFSSLRPGMLPLTEFGTIALRLKRAIPPVVRMAHAIAPYSLSLLNAGTGTRRC